MALEEASAAHSPKQLRHLFAVMLFTCNLSNPLQLWETHRESLAEDFHHQAQIAFPQQQVSYSDVIFKQALSEVQQHLRTLGNKTLKDFRLPEVLASETALPHEYLRELNYNQAELKAFIEQNESSLNPEQQCVYYIALDSIRANKGSIFFLDAPGGTGKTFLLNLLLAKVREQKKIALAVASSGIAATLLTGGRTAHSTFKLPLSLAHNDRAVCPISKNMAAGKLLKDCDLIVWDESTMSHKNAYEAIDRTLQDLRGNTKPMGGVTVLLAGDFRQTLPVVPRGTKADELHACLKSSYLWKNIRQLSLSTNMRAYLTGNQNTANFSKALLLIGDGNVPGCSPEGDIIIPVGSQVKSIKDLQNSIFPHLVQNYQDTKWLASRAILAPRNDAVDAINVDLLKALPGAIRSYLSVDTVLEESQAVHYPIEFLNSLELPGIPPHNLLLKIGAPIMLLRNLGPPKLCNGTRLTVKSLMNNVIKATILTGTFQGQCVFIPRIPIIPSDMAFEFKRLQFPLRLSFAMSINKSQGQTLSRAGLALETPCFSHGQLYVGCSRVGSSSDLFTFTPDNKTKNVVYKEIL